MAGLIVLGGAPVMAVLAIVSYSRIALGTDQGRLLFPALAPLALLLAGGLAAWLPARSQGAAAASTAAGGDQAQGESRGPAGPLRAAAAASRAGEAWLAGGLAAGMAVAALLALVAGILLPFAPPPAPDAARLAAAQRLGRRFGDAMLLADVEWGAGGAAAATPELTLYWQSVAAPGADLRTDLRVVDRAGNLAWEWKRSPGDGRFSTDRWPAGRTVADVYHVPAAAMQQAARIEVGLRPFPDGAWLPPAGAAAPFLTLWEAGG